VLLELHPIWLPEFGILEYNCRLAAQRLDRGSCKQWFLQSGRYFMEAKVMGRTSTRATFFLVLVYGFSLTQDALAYLDPGSGSMMLQLLLGGVVGVAAILKLYWSAFVGLFRRKKHQADSMPPIEVDK
jgi:hypothetical protein